ncbi:MAG: hypothetical protein WCC22_20810 [Terriglobales bacterium]
MPSKYTAAHGKIATKLRRQRAKESKGQPVYPGPKPEPRDGIVVVHFGERFTNLTPVRADPITKKAKRLMSDETKFQIWLARWMKNHRTVAGAEVLKKPSKKQLALARKTARGFYPAWVIDPWARFLYPRAAQVKHVPGQRIPLGKALDWSVTYYMMQEWADSIVRNKRAKECYPNVQAFCSRTGNRFVTRKFAECALWYARKRWGSEMGNERAQQAILGIMQYAERNLSQRYDLGRLPCKNCKEQRHKARCHRKWCTCNCLTKKRQRKSKAKFSTKNLRDYWRWILGRLHGTDKFSRPKETAEAAVTVDYTDDLGKTVDGDSQAHVDPLGQ